jgi:hypothetical protein
VKLGSLEVMSGTKEKTIFLSTNLRSTKNMGLTFFLLGPICGIISLGSSWAKCHKMPKEIKIASFFLLVIM